MYRCVLSAKMCFLLEPKDGVCICLEEFLLVVGISGSESWPLPKCRHINHCNLYFLCCVGFVLITRAREPTRVCVCVLGLDDDGDLKGNYFSSFFKYTFQDGSVCRCLQVVINKFPLLSENFRGK